MVVDMQMMLYSMQRPPVDPFYNNIARLETLEEPTRHRTY